MKSVLRLGSALAFVGLVLTTSWTAAETESPATEDSSTSSSSDTGGAGFGGFGAGGGGLSAAEGDEGATAGSGGGGFGGFGAGGGGLSGAEGDEGATAGAGGGFVAQDQAVEGTGGLGGGGGLAPGADESDDTGAGPGDAAPKRGRRGMKMVRKKGMAGGMGMGGGDMKMGRGRAAMGGMGSMMPGMGGGGGMSGMMGGGMDADPEMYALNEQDMQLENSTMTHVNMYQSADDADQREGLRNEIENLVSQHFEIRQQRRKLELARLEQQLKRLSDAIGKRTEQREAIIARRVSQLIGDEDDLGF